MPTKTVILKEGYIEDLMSNYDEASTIHELAGKIKAKKNKLNDKTLHKANEGKPVGLNTLKYIADYFGIQERYIQNSILTEEEAEEFLKAPQFLKKSNIPKIMKQGRYDD